MNEDRFVLLLDILGFKQMVATTPLDVICSRVEQVLLNECESWATGQKGRDFDTIHFSDTVLIYTQRVGAYQEWYDDLIYIGARICTRMLADEIPVRGALSYGSFLVKRSGRHQVFLGQALVDAHQKEEGGAFLGFKVTPAAWKPLHPAHTAGAGLKQMRRAIEQPDGCLLINPFTQFIGLDKRQLMFDIEHQFEHPEQSDNPWLKTELQAFKFITQVAKKYAEATGPTNQIGVKYLNTVQFLRDVLGDDLYGLAEALAERV